jgi:hypothetical protein
VQAAAIRIEKEQTAELVQKMNELKGVGEPSPGKLMADELGL